MSDAVTRWAPYVYEAQAKYGVPAPVLFGLIHVETGGVPGLVSSAGAGGITQFMPKTAASKGVNVAPGHERSQVLGAASLLVDYGWNEDPDKALASYNAGPGNWRAGIGYASDVMAKARTYAGTISPNSGRATKSDKGTITQAAQAAGDRGPWALRQLVGLVLVVGGVALFYFGGARVLGVSGSKPLKAAARGAARGATRAAVPV